jgi:hypothetical protein
MRVSRTLFLDSSTAMPRVTCVAVVPVLVVGVGVLVIGIVRVGTVVLAIVIVLAAAASMVGTSCGL